MASLGSVLSLLESNLGLNLFFCEAVLWVWKLSLDFRLNSLRGAVTWCFKRCGSLGFSPFRKTALAGRSSPFLLWSCFPPARPLPSSAPSPRIAGQSREKKPCTVQWRLASSFCRWRDSPRASSLEATSGRASKEQPVLPKPS